MFKSNMTSVSYCYNTFPTKEIQSSSWQMCEYEYDLVTVSAANGGYSGWGGGTCLVGRRPSLLLLLLGTGSGGFWGNKSGRGGFVEGRYFVSCARSHVNKSAVNE